jgi:hypothetical protein
MPLDVAWADTELAADFLVRPAGERQPCNLLLRRCELLAGVVSRLADRLAAREQLGSRALGENCLCPIVLNAS